MPKFIPNTIISDCWGSAGNVTFYHQNGVCYWRARNNQTSPGTAAQLGILDIHRRALAAWREIPDADKERWREYASVVEPHRPPFDGSGRITGHNLFVSAYHGFATLGTEHVPKPMPWTRFPIFCLEYEDAALLSGMLRIRFRLFLQDNEDYSRDRVLGKIALLTPGTGCKTSQLRNYLAEESEEPGIIEFVISSDNSTSQQLHIRYTLMDSLSGYRSQYQRLSVLINPH
ncbi:MAG: hypothetical protein NC335_08710 [Bacteroides sp.]|nr:hypothetical protein [Bacteroides sp.]